VTFFSAAARPQPTTKPDQAKAKKNNSARSA